MNVNRHSPLRLFPCNFIPSALRRLQPEACQLVRLIIFPGFVEGDIGKLFHGPFQPPFI